MTRAQLVIGARPDHDLNTRRREYSEHVAYQRIISAKCKLEVSRVGECCDHASISMAAIVWLATIGVHEPLSTASSGWCFTNSAWCTMIFCGGIKLSSKPIRK